jgi:hypothetical protein
VALVALRVEEQADLLQVADLRAVDLHLLVMKPKQQANNQS